MPSMNVMPWSSCSSHRWPRKPAPALGDTLAELERQAQNHVAAHAASRFGRAQSRRGKCRLDRIGGTDQLPVRAGKAIERQ